MEALHIPPLARRGGAKAAGWLVGDSMRKRATLWERRNFEKVRVKTFYNQSDAGSGAADPPALVDFAVAEVFRHRLPADILDLVILA